MPMYLILPFGLPAPQRLQVRVDIDEVVHLHELDASVFEQRHRALHLLDAFLLAVTARARRPDFRRDERFRLLFGRQQIAEHRFGGRIHGRGIDERGATGEKPLQHLAQRRRAASSAPTSNGPEVPRPMAGIVSPEEGMRRIMGLPAGTTWPLACVSCVIAGRNERRRGAWPPQPHRPSRESTVCPCVPRNNDRSDQRRIGSRHRRRCPGCTMCSSVSTCGSTCTA